MITSAAAVMVAVFGAFAAGGFLLVKMLGFALGVAVLLDATLIRVAVGPALLRLGGRWNWWPGTAGTAERQRHSERRTGVLRRPGQRTLDVTLSAAAGTAREESLRRPSGEMLRRVFHDEAPQHDGRVVGQDSPDEGPGRLGVAARAAAAE